MIYFLQAGTRLGPVKIGFTHDVGQRRTTLQAANPERLYVIAVIPGDVAKERRLHKRFAEGRLEGEWFRHDTPGLQDFLSDAIHYQGFPGDVKSAACKEVLSC